jgi:SAM-dependent methyltransferase
MISGIITFVINFTLLDSLWINEVFPFTTNQPIFEFFISSIFALLLSYPLHKFFTFRDGFDQFWSKLQKFILIGFFILIFRSGIFYLFLYFGLGQNISFLLSNLFIVLLNFIAFDIFIFHSNIIPDNQNLIYGQGGVGIETLETIEDAKIYNTWIADKISDYLSENNLELGAGQGTISAILSNHFRLELFEISPENQIVLHDRFKDNHHIVRIGLDFLENTEWGKYDCIYSSNVLEHLEDDEKFILHGMKLLKRGGYFVAFVPAMMELYSPMDKILGHYRRYNYRDKNRISSFLSENKISHKFLSFKYLNPIGSFGWLIKMRIFKTKKIKKNDIMIMNSILPFISFLDYLPFPWGQSIFFVIKKY